MSCDARSLLPRPFLDPVRVPALVLVLCAVFFATASPATILIFDEERDSATGTVVGATTSGGIPPADYGDRVTSAAMPVPGGIFTYGEAGEGFTPNVTIDLFSSGATETDPRVRLWNTGYGDLVNVLFSEGPGTGGSPILNVLFSADPGFVVDLYGFELAAFGSGDLTIAAVEVLAGGAPLFSQTNVVVAGTANALGRTTFNFAAPYSGAELLLRIDLSNLASGIQDNIGLDSIRFGQTPPPIPEPGTAVLIFGGLAALGAGRRARD